MYYCQSCEEYTLQLRCPRCDKQTVQRKPPRFSPQDHYGSYRRRLKKEQKGVI
jgi:H/ACA ribonucleoprotein complex subunit 3